ncbi:IS3 family transposase [Lachnospiraceae bacterium 45-W7]
MREQIKDIYHSHHEVDGYRSMTVYLARRGYRYSSATIHKYMNTEPGLHSITRKKKPDPKHAKPHRIFENKLKQDFMADKVNQK